MTEEHKKVIEDYCNTIDEWRRNGLTIIFTALNKGIPYGRIMTSMDAIHAAFRDTEHEMNNLWRLIEKGEEL